MRRIGSVAVVFVAIMMTVSINAKAAESAISPMWVNVNQIQTSLNFSGTTALCTAKIIGVTGVTRIVASMALYKKVNGSWSSVTAWSSTTNGTTLTINQQYGVAKGNDYKLVVNAAVYKGAVLESVSGSSERRCP